MRIAEEGGTHSLYRLLSCVYRPGKRLKGAVGHKIGTSEAAIAAIAVCARIMVDRRAAGCSLCHKVRI
ncbi:MAG: hypothetical protein ABI963_11025 [Rhizomicrobium sp.]